MPSEPSSRPLSQPIRAETRAALAEIFGVLLPAWAPQESKAAVTLDVLASGSVKYTVKILDNDPQTALDIANDLFAQLRERYGSP